jgi:diguanylate cyclase (GGDEF)-like protein
MDGDAEPVVAAGLRWVVVDDEAVIRRLLGEVLTDFGFEVELLSSVAETRARVARRDVDVLLIDKNLPDGNGLELCRALEAEDMPCKVVIMSGHATLDSAIDAMRHGAVDYLCKPFSAEDLRARLPRILHLVRLERSHRALVDELRLRNGELEALSVRDPLTGLFNHGHLQEALQREVARSEQHRHAFVLALLDIDGFREINERHGHTFGDRMLKEVATILRTRSRKSDLPFRIAEQEVAARYGPDVFAVILPESSRASAAQKLESLRRAVAELSFGGLPVPTLSCGFACYPEDGRDRERLVECAQRALLAAKRVGGDQLVSYSPAVGTSEEDSATLAATRARALTRSLAALDFDFAYQPIVGVNDRGTLGYEALCRPRDPAFRRPVELIEAAVRTGRIRDLGRTLRKLAVAPLPELSPSVLLFLNVHPQDLHDELFLAAESELLPWARRIVLEVTETEAIDDAARVRERIHCLRTAGFRIALDDLGSAYSSLNLLAQLEPDYVKLDMELVRGIERKGRTARLIQHLLEFCRGEQLVTIAEGIETEAELRVVSDLGVDYVQGYLLGRPGALPY